MLKQNIKRAMFISHNFINLKRHFVEMRIIIIQKLRCVSAVLFTCNLAAIALNLLIKH